jgi:glycosyltransferase involved in cell wall biosynthesis
VQAHVAELRDRLEHYEADVLTLWMRNRTDWLLGTTLRLAGDGVSRKGSGVMTIGWPTAARAQMLPWVASYYMYPAVAARRISAVMAPYVELAVKPEHELIHNHRIGREFLAQASLLAARRRRIAFVLTPHHHPKWRGRRYAGWIEVYRAADAVLTMTWHETEELVRLGVRPERIHVIGGAADPPLTSDPYRFRSRLGDMTAPLVLFIGQQYRYKGVAELVEAVEAIRARGVKAELVFLGPSTPFSARLFAHRSAPWLHVLGKVDEQTKWDAIDASSVVCLPSRHEAFGRVYVEAWSKGKPVIGARIPTAREVVTDGETGLLVDVGSAEDLARALERVLTDPQLAARLGAAGAREVDGRFSWDEVVTRVEAAYDAARAAAGGRP